MKLFLLRSSAALLIAVGIYAALVVFMSRFTMLSELPDHDYLPELRRLAAEERYSELCVLGGDLEKCGRYVGNTAFKALLDEARKKENSFISNSWKFLRGFVSGKSTGTADAAGSIVSDFLIYGDIRDLAVQAGLFVMGRETDPVIAAVSGAGVLTELFPVADWFPAALKILRKRGAFTPEFSKHISDALKIGGMQVKSHGVTADLYRLLRRQGIVRSCETMKYVKTPAQLEKALFLAGGTPEKLHLAVRATGGRVLDIKVKNTPAEIFRASQKGVDGLLTLKRGKVLVAVKIISSGRAGAFIRALAVSEPKFRRAAAFFSAVSLSGGILLLIFTLSGRKKRNFLKKIPKA